MIGVIDSVAGTHDLVRGGALDHTDDTDDLRRARAGDRDAFSALIARHAAAARRAAVFFGAGEEADDVAQESFVKAWLALDGFRGEAQFRGWLLRIVANQARNTVRSRRRREAATQRALTLADPLSALEDPAVVAEHVERGSALLAAVRSLREADRVVIVCRYFLQLDVSETASVLAIPSGTVKSRTARSLERIRRRMEEVEHAGP